ncbi:MAG: hypothetical protein NZZ41_05990 [Candidatus Dojkabacteria bacterium]|nr:hypothetical protein [Candidatus Dojkabacteria bacterium]
MEENNFFVLPSKIPKTFNWSNYIFVEKLFMPYTSNVAKLIGVRENNKRYIQIYIDEYSNHKTMHVTEQEFKLLTWCGGKKVQKKVYEYVLQSYKILINFYEISLSGLVTIEVNKEYINKIKKLLSIFKPIYIKDSDQYIFSDAYLSGQIYSDLENILKKYKYAKHVYPNIQQSFMNNILQSREQQKQTKTETKELKTK